MKVYVIKLAMVMFAFSAPVALAQVAAQQPSCIDKCGITSDACQVASTTDRGDAECVAKENNCNNACVKAEIGQCKQTAHLNYKNDVQAARVAFHTTKITVSHALKAAAAAGGNINVMFPGLRNVRDNAIASAKTKFDNAIKACK